MNLIIRETSLRPDYLVQTILAYELLDERLNPSCAIDLCCQPDILLLVETLLTIPQTKLGVNYIPTKVVNGSWKSRESLFWERV